MLQVRSWIHFYRHNTACRLSMIQYALFALHCDFIGFCVMDRLVNVGDIGRPFHQQPIPKQTAHIIYRRLVSTGAFSAVSTSNSRVGAVVLAATPLAGSYSQIIFIRKSSNWERRLIYGNSSSGYSDLLSRRLTCPSIQHRPRLLWSKSTVKRLVEYIKTLSRSLRPARPWFDKFAHWVNK